MISKKTKNLIKEAIKEDSPRGDVTSKIFVSKSDQAEAFIKVKERSVVCGVDVVSEVFSQVDSRVKIKKLKEDGDQVKKDTIIMELRGPKRSILLGERVALNFLQHLSGVSTSAALYTKLIKNKTTKILDTRKTMPGFRELQKYAVKVGGGENHRQSLSDMVLIKENHLVGLSKEALAQKVDIAKKKGLKVEIESKTLREVKQFLRLPIDVIMLDNMNMTTMKKAVELRDTINPQIMLEVSGNITVARLSSLSGLGVDYISSGSLTHSVMAVDYSLIIK